jgi:hypothetical protein
MEFNEEQKAIVQRLVTRRKNLLRDQKELREEITKLAVSYLALCQAERDLQDEMLSYAVSVFPSLKHKPFYVHMETLEIREATYEEAAKLSPEINELIDSLMNSKGYDV